MNKCQEEILTFVVEMVAEMERETGADIFVNYSPHVSCISVSIHANKWKSGHGSDFDVTFYLDSKDYDDISESFLSLENAKGLIEKHQQDTALRKQKAIRELEEQLQRLKEEQ
jgi:pyoverdine/dityrosine biosynthesis protein Dit1